MYAVYFLWSKKLKKIYIGSTSNLHKRIKSHNGGHQRYTKRGIPWKVVGYVGFQTKKLALKEERRLKKCRNKKYYRVYLLESGKRYSE